MTKNQIEQINAAAKKSGDLDAAIAEFLGCELEFKQADNKVPAGFEGAFHNIRFEVEQWNDVDAKTREGIEAFKGAKGTAEDAPAKGTKK